MFRNSGDIVHNGVYSIYHTIATYEGTSYHCSFLIYFYGTCYVASLVMDIRRIS